MMPQINEIFVESQSKYKTCITIFVGRDSSVGIATRKGCTVRGSKPGGARFSAPVQTGFEVHPETPTQGVQRLSRGKEAVVWR
jgi:hypothetical protein